MEAEKKMHFHTQVIHAALTPGEWQGVTLPPIFQTAAHCHETAENLSETFAGRTTDHIYARLSVGIEAVEDLIDDLAQQTLEKI